MKPDIRIAKKLVREEGRLLRKVRRNIGVVWQLIEDQRQAFKKSDRLRIHALSR
jgi:hypothetical protein